MKEGEVLSLESVASQLNVSAMPVREAFQILARDGLIQLRKNKAAVVLGVTETYIKEHYQLRAILEGAAARLCAAPETDISELEEIYQDSCKILENKDFSRYTDINREFHNEIWTAAGNGKMKTYINKSNDEIIKKHIANMNEFCIENIDFEQGKEQLQMIYRYYIKRFSSDEISYKNLIILKDEMSRDVNIGEKYNKNTSEN